MKTVNINTASISPHNAATGTHSGAATHHQLHAIKPANFKAANIPASKSRIKHPLLPDFPSSLI
jgi:hypothetical protein